jgi:hypothetical protein
LAIGNFSTSEVATAYKWVDGKTIYKKTINFGSLPNATSKSVAHGISGYENFISFSGWAKLSGSNVFFSLPHTDTIAANSIRVNVNSGNVEVIAGIDRTTFTTSFITVYFTKT